MKSSRCVLILYIYFTIQFRQHNIKVKVTATLLYLYRARNKITQLSIPTHAQLQRHRLKFIKNYLKSPTCFGL